MLKIFKNGCIEYITLLKSSKGYANREDLKKFLPYYEENIAYRK